MPIVFSNCTLIDGTGARPLCADVAVSGERITQIAAKIACENNPQIQRIDCSGRVLAPGFIDVHAHGELEPLADNGAAGKVLSGVTTEISGNCGHSPFPLIGPLRARFEKEAVNEWKWRADALDWSSAGEYFEVLERKRCTINRGFLLGHGSLRAGINGYADSPLGVDGKSAMLACAEEALDAGCFGISTGLVYPPGCFASREEVLDLARLCAEHGALYTSHMRSESDAVEESILETLDVCRSTGARTQISHLKTAHQRNWHKLSAIEKTLFAARKEGLDFHADRYPYTAGATSLDTILPPWAYAGGNDEELKRLKDSEICARLEAEVLALNSAPDFWERVQIASAVKPALAAEIGGKTLAQISRDWNVRPFEAFRRIAIEDELRTGAIFFMMSEENLEKILSWDFVMIASDATARNVIGPTAQASPHPRTFGTFPRTVAQYVREKKLFSLEEAVWKMTGLPARTFNIKDRGAIRPGAFADLVLFDAEKIADRATYDTPNLFPTGIDSVYVNGEKVVEAGAILEARPGKVLRRS